MDLTARRELNNGFGDALARAFELVLTPLIFIAVGFGLGTLFGARPALTFTFGAFGVIGTTVIQFYRYKIDMARHEAGAKWGPRP